MHACRLLSYESGDPNSHPVGLLISDRARTIPGGWFGRHLGFEQPQVSQPSKPNVGKLPIVVGQNRSPSIAPRVGVGVHWRLATSTSSFFLLPNLCASVLHQCFSPYPNFCASVLHQCFSPCPTPVHLSCIPPPSGLATLCDLFPVVQRFCIARVLSYLWAPGLGSRC